MLVDPGLDIDEIGHERRDTTFKDSRVASDDVLSQDFSLVELINDWKSDRVVDTEAGGFLYRNGSNRGTLLHRC